MSADPVVQPPRSHFGARPLQMTRTVPEINVLQNCGTALASAFARLGDAPTLTLVALAIQVRADEIAKGSSVEAQFLAHDLARLGSQAKQLAETCRNFEA